MNCVDIFLVLQCGGNRLNPVRIPVQEADVNLPEVALLCRKISDEFLVVRDFCIYESDFVACCCCLNRILDGRVSFFDRMISTGYLGWPFADARDEDWRWYWVRDRRDDGEHGCHSRVGG